MNNILEELIKINCDSFYSETLEEVIPIVEEVGEYLPIVEEV